MTDEGRHYVNAGKEFAEHGSVEHTANEYVRDGYIHSNTVEGYYSIFKRGMKGIYQHCSEKHLHRYLSEFDFRYSTGPLWALTIRREQKRPYRRYGQEVDLQES